LTAIDKSNLFRVDNSNTKLKISQWTMIEISRLELTKQPKITDSSKELMSSKETEKMPEKNSHILNACLLNKRLSSYSPSMEKYLTNYLPSLPIPYHCIADQASLYIRQEPLKVESWMHICVTNLYLFWQEFRKCIFITISK